MSPALGSGASTALRDAALLAAELAAAARGAKTLVQAVGGYEQQMTGYGFAAVRASGAGLTSGGLLRRRAVGRQPPLAGRLVSATRPSRGSSGERRPAAGSPPGYSSLTLRAREMATSTCSRRLAA